MFKFELPTLSCTLNFCPLPSISTVSVSSRGLGQESFLVRRLLLLGLWLTSHPSSISSDFMQGFMLMLVGDKGIWEFIYSLYYLSISWELSLGKDWVRSSSSTLLWLIIFSFFFWSIKEGIIGLGTGLFFNFYWPLLFILLCFFIFSYLRFSKALEMSLSKLSEEEFCLILLLEEFCSPLSFSRILTMQSSS